MDEYQATPQAIRDRWIGTDTLPSDDVIQKWLDDAEVLIVSEVPTIVDKLTDDPDGHWARRVAWVQTQLVMQAMKNPDGVRQKSNTAGVYTEAVTYGTETIRASMVLTPAHRALLMGRTPGKHFGLDMTVTQHAHPLDHAWVNGPDSMAPTPNEERPWRF